MVAGGDGTGIALPTSVAAPETRATAIDKEVEPVLGFTGKVVEERDGVVRKDIDFESYDRLQGMVDGSRAETVTTAMGLEGVDAPGIQRGVLPREIGEVGTLEGFKGVVGGKVVGVGVVPEPVMGCERKLQVGGAVGGGEGNGELLRAWGERRGLVWGDR